MEPPSTGRSSGKIMVAMVLGRLLGLVRDRTLFALGGFAQVNDIIAIALKLANTVQNLLGDQALSAAFIPVYSQQLKDARSGTPEAARRLAGAAFARLLVACGALGTLGALGAPWIGLAVVEKGEAAVSLLTLASYYLFPMSALLVLAAWCLAVLNSHRRFFLSYLAPAAWNVAILAAVAILTLRTTEPSPRSLILTVSVGALIGGVLQFGVQLPAAIKLNGGLPLTLSASVPGLQEVQRRFAPVLVGRGSLQLLGVAEALLAIALLTEGTVTALTAGQRLFFLTIMLCSMIQAIVYLPEFSRLSDAGELKQKFREAIHGVWFLVVPAMVGVIALGFPLIAALFRVGKFGVAENALAHLILAVYVLGLIPTASSRILQTVLYSRGETKLPALVGVLRSGASLLAAFLMMRWWDSVPLVSVQDWLPIAIPDSPLTLGALAFASASAVSASGEWLVLRHFARIEGTLYFARKGGLFAGLAVLALMPAGLIWWVCNRALDPGQLMVGFGSIHSVDLFLVFRGLLIFAAFLFSYLALTRWFAGEEFERVIRAAVRRSR